MPDLSLLAIAAPAALWAGISKGGFGSGAAFAAALILALVFEPATALGIMLPVLMLIDVVTVRGFWRRWDTRSSWALILGGGPGVLLGVGLFAVANDDVIRLLIAAVALGFVAWQVAGRAGLIHLPLVPFRWSSGLLAGAVGGFTSFISHAGGPPVAVFLLSQGMSKTTYQATTAISFWVINVFKAVPYGIMGFFTAETLQYSLWIAPFAVGGALLGIRAHHLLPERLYFGVTYVLLTATGLKLLWDALT